MQVNQDKPTSSTQTDIDRVRRAIQVLGESMRGLAAFHVNACVRCGLCGETCHVYQSDPVPDNLPGSKVSQVASFYRRYHTLLGRIAPFIVGARDVTMESLEELVEHVYGRCTACGRCSLHCSVGADIASIIRSGRNMLVAAGLVPPNLQAVVDNQLTTGNQMRITSQEIKDTANWIAGDLEMEMSQGPVEIPVDVPDSEFLYLVNPREIKFFPLSLMSAAGIFHTAGASWTLSSTFCDVTNYGLFSGDNLAAFQITQQVIDEASRLNVKQIVLSECGHGFRSFRWEGPEWRGSPYPVSMRSVLEVILEYLESGRIKVDPTRNPDRVTLHDPCNLVRWGGVSEPQREILKRTVMDFVEMIPNRAQNFCCGGGGGMLSMSEYGERRTASGTKKADQIRASGAKIVATPCHNCADQLLDLTKKMKLGVSIQSISEIVYNALIFK